MSSDAIAGPEFTLHENGAQEDSDGAQDIPWEHDLPEGPSVHLTCPVASYILWLVCSDLRAWSETRQTKYLTKSEATAFAMFFKEVIPKRFRTEVPSL